MEIDSLLVQIIKNKGSDLHLKIGHKPVARINGKLYEIGNNILTGADIENLTFPIMDENQKNNFMNSSFEEFVYSISLVGRFKVTLYRDRGQITASIRAIKSNIPSFVSLRVPEEIRKLTDYTSGIIIICGGSRSGKSTFSASLIQEINMQKSCRIVTIEDPIEYSFQDKQSLISQVELGRDIQNLAQAKRLITRSDAEIIYLSEVRNADELDFLLHSASTGHLVITTFNANTSALALFQLIRLIPHETKEYMIHDVAANVKAVVGLKLLSSTSSEMESILATELLTVNNFVSNLIQKNDLQSTCDFMASSKDPNTFDFNRSYMDLIKKKLITKKTALENSPNPEKLKMLLQGIAFDSLNISNP